MSDINQSQIYWYKSPEDELHSQVFQYVHYLNRNQSYKADQNLKYFRLYGNSDVLPFNSFSFYRAEPSSAPMSNRVTMNVVQSMIDTVVSKITKNKPRPMFLTDGGDWSLQRKAKKLTQFIEGQFYSTDFYAKSAVAFLHACIFGTGALKIFRSGSEIKCEHVFIDEIVVDDEEAIYGQPRQMHQRKWIHREILKQMFPGKAKQYAIDVVGKPTEDYMQPQSSDVVQSEMIQVIESWHLPSGKDADDGRHTITIENCTLLDEPYEKDYFPFVFFRWGLRPLGFFGQGISEQLQGLQLEINKILRTIQVSMHLVSIPKIFVEASSKIVTAHLNNKIGGIIKYAGIKPEPGQLGIIPPELFSHLDRLYGRCYEVIGVSQLAATSAKPAGLNSGKALRMYNDIETERFMSVGMRYEQAFLEAAKQFIDLAREIEDTEEDGLKVKVKGDKFMKTIKWKEVDIDDDKYLMQMFPTNALSKDPSSRLQEVQELMQAGMIGKENGMKLLNFPDLEAFYNMENAGIEDIERQIEMMIDDGDYQSPEPYQNLPLGIQKMQQAYLMYRAQGAPDERLELFRRWISDADDLMKSAQAAAMQMAQQAQPAPVPLPANAQTPIA
jgi:hypothetical protein